MKLLTYKEEKELNKEQKEQYYQDLRAYCRKRKLKNTTKGAMTIAPYLKKRPKRLPNVIKLSIESG